MEEKDVLLSASGLKTWLGCQRKWAYQYVLGLRAPGTKSTALGTAVHKMLEQYLRDGTPLDYTIQTPEGVFPAEIAATGLQFLPEPKDPDVVVEGSFMFSVPDLPGVSFRGFVDVSIAPGEDGIPEVLDHKTTGNWDYALTSEALEGDIQAIMYAKYALIECPDAPAVRLQWTYFGTKPKYRAKPVVAVVTREHVEKLFSEVVSISEEVATTFRANRQPLDLPPEPGECDKYGGCPFRGKCNLSPKERRPFAMSNTAVTTQSLVDRIRARTGAPSASAAAAAPSAPAQQSIAEKIAAAKAKTLAAAEANVQVPANILRIGAAKAKALAAAESSVYAPGSEPVAPADAPGSEPVAPADVSHTAFAPPPPLPLSDQAVNCPTDFQPAPSTVQEIEQQASATVAELVPAAAPKPKGPGRPKGAKSSAAAAGPEAIDVEAVEALTTFLRVATAWLNKQMAEGS